MPNPTAPTGEELLRLERRSRQQGSGIGSAELVGVWQLDQLWAKRDASPQASAAALLRGLQARLSIEADNGGGLQLRNSVQLGPLELRFLGPGVLRGRRPLLEFGFERWQLGWGTRVLTSGRLAAPEPRRRPFFALIACSQAGGDGAWLAARGRGGGLALWRR